MAQSLLTAEELSAPAPTDLWMALPAPAASKRRLSLSLTTTRILLLVDLTRPPVILPRLMLSQLLLLIPDNNPSTSNLETTPLPRPHQSKLLRPLELLRVPLREPLRPSLLPQSLLLLLPRRLRFWRLPSPDLTPPSMLNNENKRTDLLGWCLKS